VPEPILSERQPAHEPRASGDVGSDPAVQERERKCGRWQQRLEQRAHEREAEQRAHRQGDQHVRKQRVDRHAPELEPQDRAVAAPQAVETAIASRNQPVSG
jgi:hypothetical protein